MKQTALRDTSTPTTIDAITGTWCQVGIVSKEMPEIGWRTNVFPNITAVLTIRVGFLAHTLQSPKVWSIVESVFPGHTPAVIGITISE